MPIDSTKMNEPKKAQKSRSEQKKRVNEAVTESRMTIDSGISRQFKQASTSLQKLDEQLGEFEERFAESAVQRVQEVPARIAMRVADLLEVEGSQDPLDWGFDFQPPDLTSLPRERSRSQLQSGSSPAALLAS